MYKNVSLVRAFQSGCAFLYSNLGLLLVSSFGFALLWSLTKVAAKTLLPLAGVAGSLILGLYMLFWFRHALAASPLTLETMDDANLWRRLTLWGKAVLRSLGVGCLIVAALTVPTVALAYARIFSQGPLMSPHDAQAAVDWALPIAAALASPVIIRLYIYYTALAAGRSDISIADAWRWGRGNSLRILALLAAPLLTVFALHHLMNRNIDANGWDALPGTFAGGFFVALLLALAMTLLSRALSGLVASPVRS